MSTVDINCSVLISLDVLFVTLFFEVILKSVEICVKSFLLRVATAAAPAAKEGN